MVTTSAHCDENEMTIRVESLGENLTVKQYMELGMCIAVFVSIIASVLFTILGFRIYSDIHYRNNHEIEVYKCGPHPSMKGWSHCGPERVDLLKLVGEQQKEIDEIKERLNEENIQKITTTSSSSSSTTTISCEESQTSSHLNEQFMEALVEAFGICVSYLPLIIIFSMVSACCKVCKPM